MPEDQRDLVIVHIEGSLKHLEIMPSFIILEPQEIDTITVELADNFDLEEVAKSMLYVRAMPTCNLEYRGTKQGVFEFKQLAYKH